MLNKELQEQLERLQQQFEATLEEANKGIVGGVSISGWTAVQSLLALTQAVLDLSNELQYTNDQLLEAQNQIEENRQRLVEYHGRIH